MENKKKYEINDFLAGYAKGKGHNPEDWIKDYVVNKMSSNITTIIDFGCANGRNFIPFPKEKYKYIGFDIHDYDDIIWMNNIEVEYYTCSLEDFFIDYSKYNLDWENSLIMIHLTLMYLDTANQQNKFIDLLKSLGCKNFVFHEYGNSKKVLSDLSEHARNKKLGYLDLNETNKKMFEPPFGNIFKFRDFNNDMCAFIHLIK